MITQTRHESGGTAFFANGERFVILTAGTTSEELVKFNRAAHANDEALCAATQAAKERREWNIAHPGQGKDWPAFRALEKLIDRLCKEAGIRDS